MPVIIVFIEILFVGMVKCKCLHFNSKKLKIVQLFFILLAIAKRLCRNYLQVLTAVKLES